MNYYQNPVYNFITETDVSYYIDFVKFFLNKYKLAGIPEYYFKVDKYFNSKSVELFTAVFIDDTEEIEKYVEQNPKGVNDLLKDKRNALQTALALGVLKIKSCISLINFGINLENEDFNGNTVLASLVSHYKCPYYKSNSELQLQLFRSIIEGGANLNVKEQFLGKKTNIREKIRSLPEMEEIVQNVNIKRANQVFVILQGEFQITRLVCEMLDLDPGNDWRPI